MFWDILQTVNTVAWVASNVLIAYIAVVLVIFTFGYQILHDPRATTAGRFVFRFVLSLIGVIGLVFISIFIDPRMGGEWYAYPGDVHAWRPLLRFGVYAYVAYAVSALTVLIVVRRWRPDLLRTAEDHKLLINRKFKRNRDPK